jgi:hypothetical protein
MEAGMGWVIATVFVALFIFIVWAVRAESRRKGERGDGYVFVGDGGGGGGGSSGGGGGCDGGGGGGGGE